MPALTHLLGALCMGALFASFLPLQAQIGRTLASPVLANVSFYGMGLAASLAIAIGTGYRLADLERFGAVAPWMYVAGVLSALMILGNTILIPHVGPGVFFVLFVTGQMVMGSTIGHFGLLGSTPDPVSLKVLLGIGFVILGAWLVTTG